MNGKVWFVFILIFLVLVAVWYGSQQWGDWENTFDKQYKKVVSSHDGDTWKKAMQMAIKMHHPVNPYPPKMTQASVSIHSSKKMHAKT